jgi:formamidopyrimidine-DNA glycosylase
MFFRTNRFRMKCVMPELPEVENVRRLLAENLHQHVFRSVEINRLDVIKSSRPAPRDRPLRMLVDGCLSGFHRHGKRLALEVDDGRALEFSLGMSGQLMIEPLDSKEAPDHAHLIWTLEHRSTGRSRRLIWRDPRRFGGVWAWPMIQSMIDQKWSLIGTDALEMECEPFKSALKKTRRSIKTTLLDQNLISGIGNIYADEALHRARIRPRRMASRLRHLEIELLHRAIQEILMEAIEAGGSTIQTFKDPRGGEGRYQGAHAVYGRSGQPCRTCSSVIRSMTLNGRTTSWCSICQK